MNLAHPLLSMSDILESIILGITQGIAEFLPISSSGHLVIVSHLMQGKTLDLTLNIALHVGTLVAVLYFFREDWQQLIQALWRRLKYKEKSFESDTLFPSLIIGTLPAALIGLTCKDFIETKFHNPLVVTIPLALVGIAIWLVDKKSPVNKDLKQLSLKDGLIIGVFQAIALIPGVSRSGITLLAGRKLGYSRMDAARYSFLLGTPAMSGAAILEAEHMAASMQEPSFYVGVITSAIVGCLAIKFFLSFIARFGLFAFAAYRLVLALIIAYLVT